MPHSDILTIGELAEYLRLSQSTLYQLAREGSIPGKKVGGRWQFHREAVDLWYGASADDNHHRKQYMGVEAESGLIETFDIDEHASAVSPFKVQRNQISAGRFHSKLSYVKIPGMAIYEDHWSRRAESFGTSPEGLIMLGTNVAWQRSRVDWCGGVIDHRRFACGEPGIEVDFNTPDLNHHVVMLVDPELLGDILGSEMVNRLTHRRHIECSPVDGKRLIAILTGIVRKYMARPELLDDPCEINLVQSRVFESLSSCFAYSESIKRLEPVSFCHRAVYRATEFLAHQPKPVTARELAAISGASQRTLEKGFRDVFGLTPGAYLQTIRMNRAHQDLSIADPHLTTVTTVAQKWGFIHAGRFSAKHHKLFGEVPSAVLHRVRPSIQYSPLLPHPPDQIPDAAISHKKLICEI